MSERSTLRLYFSKSPSSCAMKGAALILIVDPASLNAFEAPKALASRAFEWPIAAALVATLLTYGRAIVPASRLHVVVLAVLGAAALSTVFAADRYTALFGDPENYAGLTFLLDMAVLYLALAVAIRDERDAFVPLGALALAAGFAMAYGTVQWLGLDPLAWAADPRSRPFATFGNADHFGHFLSVVFGIFLGAALAGPRGRARVVAGVGAVVALGVAAIVATRGTALGIAAAAAGAASVVRPRGRILVVAAAAALVLAAGLAFTPLGQRVVSGGAIGDRISLWEIAARATLARPLVGYGVDGFRVAFADQRTTASLASLASRPQATDHDWIADAAATSGLLSLPALRA